MARRTNKNSTAATATAERPNEVQEDTVSTTLTEAPEASTDEAPVAENAAAETHEAEIDLTAFEASIQAAIADTESRDQTTGELPPTLLEPVNVEFRKLEGAKAKNKARAHLNSLMKDAMNALDMPLARSYMILSDGLSAGGGHAKTERVPADPTEAFVQRVGGLRLALDLVQANVPEGVEDAWTEKVQELLSNSEGPAAEYLEWVGTDEEDRGEEPEVSSVVKAAVKLAQGKSAKVGGGSRAAGGTFDGPRRDIGKHIQSAFDAVEEGTFLTVAEIRKHTSEEYGDNPPSAGAISARLFPTSGKCTVEGIEPGTNEAGRKGARKVAA